MRTYGRIYAADGSYIWEKVSTDANGNNDAVWLTTLIQCIKLNLGESPFWASYGIPAQQTVVTNIIPTFYVNMLVSQFSRYFQKLSIVSTSNNPPTYTVNVTLHNGAALEIPVAV